SGVNDPILQATLSRYPALKYIHTFTGNQDRAQTPFISRQVLVAGDIATALRADWNAMINFFQENFTTERLILDWGMGFGKTPTAQATLLAEAIPTADAYWACDDFQGGLMMGLSRKSFLAAQAPTMSERDRLAEEYYAHFAQALASFKHRFYWRQHLAFGAAASP
ncbi:MAG: dihydropteroate synthase, partial [Bacteriovoracaceae bacterium]|nr:dihydropteroate synthase [Bacteriovoracaceae bacterium]